MSWLRFWIIWCVVMSVLLGVNFLTSFYMPCEWMPSWWYPPKRCIKECR